MSQSRLTLALTNGALTVPKTGRIAVFGPRPDMDLSALPKDRVHIIQGFFPDHLHWSQRGYQTDVAPSGPYAAAVICLPRAKSLARAWVHQAVQITGAGLVFVDGQKNDGIDSLAKALRLHATMAGVIAKAHGKLIWFEGGDIPDWQAQDTELDGGFITRPGVFSADGVDKGSAALQAALPPHLKGRVADLGAGWGFLARDILTRDTVTTLDLIEADHVALDCARLNVTDPRARFIWTDATTYFPDDPYDVVISNPPFHTGRAGDPGLGRGFIHAAAAMLKPSGQFWMVANRHLPYEATLAEHFHVVSETGGTPGFKVLHATKRIRKTR